MSLYPMVLSNANDVECLHSEDVGLDLYENRRCEILSLVIFFSVLYTSVDIQTFMISTGARMMMSNIQHGGPTALQFCISLLFLVAKGRHYFEGVLPYVG